MMQRMQKLFCAIILWDSSIFGDVPLSEQIKKKTQKKLVGIINNMYNTKLQTDEQCKNHTSYTKIYEYVCNTFASLILFCSIHGGNIIDLSNNNLLKILNQMFPLSYIMPELPQALELPPAPALPPAPNALPPQIPNINPPPTLSQIILDMNTDFPHTDEQTKQLIISAIVESPIVLLNGKINGVTEQFILGKLPNDILCEVMQQIKFNETNNKKFNELQYVFPQMVINSGYHSSDFYDKLLKKIYVKEYGEHFMGVLKKHNEFENYKNYINKCKRHEIKIFIMMKILSCELDLSIHQLNDLFCFCVRQLIILCKSIQFDISIFYDNFIGFYEGRVRDATEDCFTELKKYIYVGDSFDDAPIL